MSASLIFLSVVQSSLFLLFSLGHVAEDGCCPQPPGSSLHTLTLVHIPLAVSRYMALSDISVGWEHTTLHPSGVMLQSPVAKGEDGHVILILGGC